MPVEKACGTHRMLRLIQKCAEFIPQQHVGDLKKRLRGIYVLYKRAPGSKGGKDIYNLVYVGMARSGRGGGIRGRLKTHLRRKGRLWTHFSVFEVWGNIGDEEVAELEGMFRHIYRHDRRANTLNVQRGFKALRRVRNNRIENWPIPPKRGRSS